jgi:hypothetical protein
MSSSEQPVTDWLLRIGDGEHFMKSAQVNTWGIDSQTCLGKWFVNKIIPGDRLWFVKSKNKGLIVAVATFVKFKKREVGPLIAFTATNEELGWTKKEGKWDTELHFSNLYNLSACDLKSEILCPSTFRVYNENQCKINLPVEYSNIVRYSKLTTKMTDSF